MREQISFASGAVHPSVIAPGARVETNDTPRRNWGRLTYDAFVLCSNSGPGGGFRVLNRITTTTLVAMLYVIATCGALFFSGFRLLVLLAWLNMVGLLTVMVVRRLEFTSIWCAYAAVVSAVIYFFFRRSRPVRPANYSLELAI